MRPLGILISILVILSLVAVIVLSRGGTVFYPPHGDEIWENLTPSEGFDPWFGGDPFTTEVALSKSGMRYNLSEIMKIENVIGEESITYRSHYNPDVSVVLTKTRFYYGHGDSYSPYLLSVGLKIPSKHHTRPEVEVIVEFDNLPEEPDENILRALGYEGSFETGYYDPRTSTYYQYDGIMSIWTKGEIEIAPGWEINKVWTIVCWEGHKENGPLHPGTFRALINFENSLTTELENELKTILEAHGISSDVWERASVETWIYEEELLSFPTVDIDPEAFDWGEAMRVELTWLRDNGVISGITDSDIESISSLCRLRTSGYNGRVVFYNGKWMYYHETGLSLIE